ncbi:MAG: IS3 family transposase [Saprospiraceae bacterium]
MIDLYLVAGISKQTLFKYRQCIKQKSEIEQQVIKATIKIRKNHKRMSCRRMYSMVKQDIPIGRDQFEMIGYKAGFKIKRKVNPHKTTWGQRIEICPNLIEGKTLTNINQVWQCDIFYLKVENRNYYAVTIMDVFSRKLLALNVSRTLRSEQSVHAIKTALRERKVNQIPGCIFHSDTGSQFISERIKNVLKKAKMKRSMCKMSQENAYMERLQGILQQEYFNEHQLKESTIQKYSEKVVQLYNKERPHGNLNNKSPEQYEHDLKK